MRRVWLIHGIHATNGGPTALLAPYFVEAGFDVRLIDYGWATGIFSRFTNGRRARAIARQVGPDDLLLGHSNGGTLAWMVQELVPVAGMILVRPALDEDKRFPRARWVDVYHGEKDHVAELSEAAGFFDLINHPYGRLGRIGYRGPDRHVVSIDDEKLTVNLVKIDLALPPVIGHSGMFAPGHIEHWGPFYARRARARCEEDDCGVRGF